MSEQKARAIEGVFRHLMLGATSDSVVRWDALGSLQGGAGMTERQRAEHLIRAANGDRVAIQDWNRFAGAELVGNADTRTFVLPQSELVHLRDALKRAMGRRGREKTEFATSIAKYASARVVLVPQLHQTMGRVDRIIAKNFQGALAYALWLFFDDKKPFGADLCQCQYSECQRFFFKIQGMGAPVRRFCRPEHAELGDREAAVRRMRKLRR